MKLKDSITHSTQRHQSKFQKDGRWKTEDHTHVSTKNTEVGGMYKEVRDWYVERPA